ncbi:uncharacterized protein LOC106780099 [Vigna radiata var. radiata]|uniref:Uncharacterized protein LOC106780099 n=1 Tax=Vigna radiata var. radiata TaxID=3916 RepID=A0A1S3VZL6_VIGRR|nr:uncharacterized protein LOC106780099 [Vigna radiata var. radiata]
MADVNKPSENQTNSMPSENQTIVPGTQTVFAKSLPDVSKIEIFSGQNFRHWQERVSTLLDMYGVADALSSPKPDSTIPSNSKLVEEWTYANKVCRHTLFSALSNDLFDVYCSYKEAKDTWDSLILKYTAEDVVRQRFVIGNYYRWEMIEDKDIKTQINEYHKLLEDIKAENVLLPDEFVSQLLIEKLPPSWTDYKQQLKHRHKQMSLSELITHIIVEDTNRKECATARAKALSAKANVVDNRPALKRYEHKPDHNKKNYFRKSRPNGSNPTFKKKGNCFVCGKSGHHAPQCRRRARNDNPPRANIVEGDDIVVAVVSQCRGWRRTCIPR